MMRLAVSLSTALILIVFGLLWMVIMAFGAYGYDTSNGLAALIAGAVLLIITIVIATAVTATTVRPHEPGRYSRPRL